jgi:hypothetical protein
MQIADHLFVQLVEREPDRRDVLVFLDNNNGGEGLLPTEEITGFTKRLYDEIARGVDSIEVDGIVIGRPAFPLLIAALTYFAGVVPHFTDADQE